MYDWESFTVIREACIDQQKKNLTENELLVLIRRYKQNTWYNYFQNIKMIMLKSGWVFQALYQRSSRNIPPISEAHIVK